MKEEILKEGIIMDKHKELLDTFLKSEIDLEKRIISRKRKLAEESEESEKKE
jgi:hypothetical protein